MGLRARKRQRTRERILMTSYRLFSEQGYDDTTIDEIAAEADVSPRTFYRYFDTKDGVLAEAGYEVVDRALDRLDEAPSLLQLVTALAATFDELVAEDHFTVTLKLVREHPRVADRVPLWRAAWAKHLEQGLLGSRGGTEGAFRVHLDSRVAIATVSAVIDEWLYRRPDSSISALAADATELLARQLDAQDPPSTDGATAP